MFGAHGAVFYRIGLWLKLRAQRHPGGTGSLLLHFALLVALLNGLPDFFKKEPASYNVISIDVIPMVSDLTNIKIDSVEEQKAPPIKSVKAKPAPPKPSPLPIAKPTISIPEPETRTKEKEEKNDFESVLKSVDDMKKEKKEKPLSFDPEKPLSISEVDAIITQISKCWAIPAGARDADSTSVRLRISLAVDGSLTSVKIVDEGRYNEAGETFFRAWADSAVRAVRGCSPITGLPPKKYKSWSELELNFDPRKMFR